MLGSITFCHVKSETYRSNHGSEVARTSLELRFGDAQASVSCAVAEPG